MGKSFSQKTMVVRTDVCHYCDHKIYPGHGVKTITRDGKIFIYLHKKARHQALRKTKAQNIKWTTAWRRVNKKIKTTELGKKKRRRAKKIVREIAGMTAEEINRKKAETAADRDVKRAEAIRQIKDRKVKMAKTNQAKNVGSKAQGKPAGKQGKKGGR